MLGGLEDGELRSLEVPGARCRVGGVTLLMLLIELNRTYWCHCSMV